VRIETLLNRVQKFKSFVYGAGRIEEVGGSLRLVVEICPRANGKPVCSGCRKRRTGYDRLPARLFEFIPVWGIAVFFQYAMRRVQCNKCGVVVESVPWAQGKHHLTTTYAWFLSHWAKKLSWSDVASSFKTSWMTVYRAIDFTVAWGLNHRDLAGITAIGVDEIQWKRGHKYLTLVYQINDSCKRLLWVGVDRSEETFSQFFKWFGESRSMSLKFICSDMWKPYLKVIKKYASSALNILDRYHVVAQMNKALDKVRAEEARDLVAKGYEPVLKHSRWCLLKRPDNMTDCQSDKLKDLLQYNLKSIRAYLLKEQFQFFWEYVSPTWAGKFLDKWCTRTMRSKIEPMKKIAKMIRRHKPLLLNWFQAKNEISLGAVEGLNNKVKVATRKAYGYRTENAAKIALYHTMGALPEPKWTHKFW
jgi:transposase